MQVRQSDLKLWQSCPLKYRYKYVDGLSELQSGSSVFGSIMHDCVMYLETTEDLDAAIQRFYGFWRSPETLDPSYSVDYYVRATNWKKFNERGPEILRHWWQIIQWDTDLVLAREYTFNVPIGNGHTLHGTVDKLVIRWHAATEQWVVLISDYKTNNKIPTYDYLEEDLQFSAYGYASKQPEFWLPIEKRMGLAPGTLFAKYQDYTRWGEWVQLTGWKRMDAGIREERHFNRLIMAVNALADSVAFRIFVPTISGESCRYCEFRAQCGLPELIDPDGDDT